MEDDVDDAEMVHHAPVTVPPDSESDSAFFGVSGHSDSELLGRNFAPPGCLSVLATLGPTGPVLPPVSNGVFLYSCKPVLKNKRIFKAFKTSSGVGCSRRKGSFSIRVGLNRPVASCQLAVTFVEDSNCFATDE